MFFNKIPSVTFSELSSKDKIIDVREVNEFKRGHLPNAKNVPLSTIENYSTNDKVYVICASGARSKRAVKYLRNKGIDAINIKGGMMYAKR